MFKMILQNQENPLIRLIRVLTMWRFRGYILGKHHRTRATMKVALVQRGDAEPIRHPQPTWCCKICYQGDRHRQYCSI